MFMMQNPNPNGLDIINDPMHHMNVSVLGNNLVYTLEAPVGYEIYWNRNEIKELQHDYSHRIGS